MSNYFDTFGGSDNDKEGSGVQTGFGEFISKEAAAYTPTHGTSPERCGICYHYTGFYCTKVLGDINPNGWCMFFFKSPLGSDEEDTDESIVVEESEKSA